MTLYSPHFIGPLWGGSELFLALARQSKGDAVSKDRHSLAVIWLVVGLAATLGVLAAYMRRTKRLVPLVY